MRQVLSSRKIIFGWRTNHTDPFKSKTIKIIFREKIKQKGTQLVPTDTFRYNEFIYIASFLIDWLPIKFRAHSNIILIIYKTLNYHSLYLSDPIMLSQPKCLLRSTSSLFFLCRRSNSFRMGDRVFSVIVLKLWNKLPNNIPLSSFIFLFKNSLKNHLFSLVSLHKNKLGQLNLCFFFPLGPLSFRRKTSALRGSLVLKSVI